MKTITAKYNPDSLPRSECSYRIEDLRLLSINEARKLLGIRHDTLKKLIQQGDISFIEVENRIKISYKALSDFISGNSKRNISNNMTNVERDIDTIISKSKI